MLKKNLTYRLVNYYLSNVYIRGVAVATAVAISDYIWTRYIQSVAEGSALAGASWSVPVILLSAYVTVSYIKDKRLIAAAAIGAFIGTYFGI